VLEKTLSERKLKEVKISEKFSAKGAVTMTHPNLPTNPRLSALTGGGYARGDFGVALAVPFYKGGFGDAKGPTDLCEAGAMETQADEFVTDGV